MICKISSAARGESGLMSHWPAESFFTTQAGQYCFLSLSSRYRVCSSLTREEFLSITFHSSCC